MKHWFTSGSWEAPLLVVVCLILIAGGFVVGVGFLAHLEQQPAKNGTWTPSLCHKTVQVGSRTWCFDPKNQDVTIKVIDTRSRGIEELYSLVRVEAIAAIEKLNGTLIVRSVAIGGELRVVEVFPDSVIIEAVP